MAAGLGKGLERPVQQNVNGGYLREEGFGMLLFSSPDFSVFEFSVSTSYVYSGRELFLLWKN